MTRDEEINKAYDKWQDDLECSERTVWQCACRWADEHPKNPWRDAKKELPKIGKEVYIKTQLGFNYIGYLKKRTIKKGSIWCLINNGYASIFNPVTHWMPIPELPREDLNMMNTVNHN